MTGPYPDDRDALFADVETDALAELVEARQRRHDREVLGAWRAGYDYLYLVHENVADPDRRLVRSYYPSDTQLSDPPGSRFDRVFEYDLTRVDIEEVTRRESE